MHYVIQTTDTPPLFIKATETGRHGYTQQPAHAMKFETEAEARTEIVWMIQHRRDMAVNFKLVQHASMGDRS